MDSRSRRLPFCLSSSRSSYTPSQAVSSSSLGSSMMYNRETVLNNDRFPRASSTYKVDQDQQSSRFLTSSRDYSSSASRSTSWKLPSSQTSSSRSYDRPWAESSLSTRSKLTESQGRLGMHSGLLNASDDGDSKRAKLSYSNGGLYSRTASTSVTRSSNVLSSGRGTAEKQNDTFDSPWSSCRLLSRSSSSSSSSSSKPLLSRREQETKNEPSHSSLGDRRIRTPGLTPSLYQTDRVASTYAQGARPKETAYAPSSISSSTARESCLNHHLSSSTSHRSLVHDFGNRTTTRFLNGSSTRHSSQEQMGNPESSADIPSSYSSHAPWYVTPQTRPEPTFLPRLVPEGGEPEGRRSTRRLLSRLFSRCSSQDSSTGSSSVRSLDDDTPSTGGESVDSDEGARMSCVSPDAGGSETTLGSLRNHRADLATIVENGSNGYRSGMAQSRTALQREPGIHSGNNTSSGGGSNTSSGGGSSSTWLSSSLRSRCPPLLSRLRRHTRNASTHSAAGLQEGYSRPQHHLRRWDDPEYKTSHEEEEEEEEEEDDDDDDDDDHDHGDEEEEEEEEEGAVGLEAFGTVRPRQLENETLPELEDVAEFSPRRRVAVYANISVSRSPLSGVEGQLDNRKDKSCKDEEKLRKIKER